MKMKHFDMEIYSGLPRVLGDQRTGKVILYFSQSKKLDVNAHFSYFNTFSSGFS